MSRKVGLDFTGVESFKRASEGEHVCKIASAEVKQSSGGNDMIVVSYEVTKGEDKTARVYENYPLVSTALWKLKAMLQAIGMKADGKVSLDLDRLIGKMVIVVVKHEEYDGKTRARVDEVRKFSAASTDDDEDEAEEADDFEEEDEKPKKTAKKVKKPEKEIMPPPVNDDDDDWDDDEEEEEEPPKKSSKAEKPKATEKKAPKKPTKVEEDDDDDWDDEDWDE